MGEENYLLAKILQKMTFDPINILKFWGFFFILDVNVSRKNSRQQQHCQKANLSTQRPSDGIFFKLQLGFVTGQKSGCHEITEQPTCFHQPAGDTGAL